jgi:HPt (histidine-containing phosphotransfer) domain-containing protein
VLNADNAVLNDTRADVIDLAILQDMRAICMTRQDFGDLIDIYLDDLAAKISLLAGAIGTGDMDAVCSIAHAMKSSSMSMGATQLGALFTTLNTTAKDPQHPALKPQFVALSAMHKQVDRQLRKAWQTLA